MVGKEDDGVVLMGDQSVCFDHHWAIWMYQYLPARADLALIATDAMVSTLC